MNWLSAGQAKGHCQLPEQVWVSLGLELEGVLDSRQSKRHQVFAQTLCINISEHPFFPFNPQTNRIALLTVFVFSLTLWWE